MKQESANHPQFTIRRGTVSDIDRIRSLFEREYGESSHPCLDERYVRNAVVNKSELWFVADQKTEAAIGCMSVSYNAQNRSWEFGRAMICRHHRKTGVLGALMRSATDAMPVSEHDLVFAIARNDIALRAMQGHIDSVVVGHDGAPNMVHGVHEHHVVAIERFRSPKFRHCLPLSSAFRDSGFVDREILGPLCLAGTPEQYPDTCFWGHGDDYSDGFTFRRDNLVDAVYLCQHIGGPFTAERDVTADLLRFLSRHCVTTYIGAIVLADKLTVIKAMLKAGFHVTAYLPAWHWSRGARYDCVLLARRGRDCANKNGLDADIDAFDTAYRDIGQHILAT
ncbi:hypothetical protein [Burkholderia ambifaria]|uniref:hypothetical protein n=1 Tax=Burkholderia ambifaria TaxID=152480 RepID=UPI000A2EE94C|nr:hypothetical protein [Burkholderia ambifaria]